MTIDHYENFPVASLLLPARLRPAVINIYRFARTADDIADEGQATPEQRLQQLTDFHEALQTIANRGTYMPAHWPRPELARIFLPLAQTIAQHQLPLEPFHDLLMAFEQDVHQTRYDCQAMLLDYCTRSANPVGRLMLHLYGAVTPENMQAADAICTGLQLTNFWQDVAIDWHKNRIYIPLDAMAQYQVDPKFIAENTGRTTPLPYHPNWQALMQAQVDDARDRLRAGKPLGRRLKGRIGYELRMVVEGGLRICERLEHCGFDIFTQRPVITKTDWIKLAWRAL